MVVRMDKEQVAGLPGSGESWPNRSSNWLRAWPGWVSKTDST